MFGTKAGQIAHLKGALAERDATIGRLQEMLSLKVVADGIGLAVTRTLVEWQVSPEQAEEVRAGVEFVVAQAEKSRLVEELTHSVVAKRYEEVAAEYRVKNGDHIKTQLTELFEADGTFKRTAAEAKAAVTAELQQEVVGGYRNKVVEEMHTSGEADEIRQQMLVDYATSQQALEVRRAVEEELRDSLMPGVQAEVKQNIVREVAAGEGAKRAELNDELADGREMTEFRKEETRRFTSIWEKATLEELKEKASTDAERAAIQKRIDQITHEASEVEAARVWCELLNAYKKQGIDTSVIESGTNVVIYLDGENAARMVKNPKYLTYSYGQPQNIMEEYLSCRRKMVLSARGGGRFEVISDQLSHSLSASRAKNKPKLIPEGTVIVLGRVVKENGKQTFEERLRDNSVLCFDDDTTTPAVINTGMRLSVLQIGDNAMDADKIKVALDRS